jgi:hypothetical protein
MAASSNHHPELPYYSTQSDNYGVKPYASRVKKFIKMVNFVEEEIIDNRIQDDRYFKGKTAEHSYYSHYNNYFGAKCYVFGVKESIIMINWIV